MTGEESLAGCAAEEYGRRALDERRIGRGRARRGACRAEDRKEAPEIRVALGRGRRRH